MGSFFLLIRLGEILIQAPTKRMNDLEKLQHVAMTLIKEDVGNVGCILFCETE